MTISDGRLEEMQRLILASGIEPVGDPEELSRLSIRTHLVNAGITEEAVRPEVDVRLHGPGVPGHEIAVREAVAILGSVQEVIASIGQALTHEPTARGVIQAQILKATELRMSSSVGMGSVMFRLTGPGGDVLGEQPAFPDSDTLTARAVRELLSLVEQSGAQELEAGALARDLRPLGPRAAKHLSDLIKRVVDNGIDVDFTWRGPGAQHQHASLQRRSALVMREAIDRNRVEAKEVTLTGLLVTVSKVMKAELLTEEEGRVKLSADDDLAASLGPYFNQRVIVRAEQITIWSTNTGEEKRTFRMLEIGLAESSGDSPAQPVTSRPALSGE